MKVYICNKNIPSEILNNTMHLSVHVFNPWNYSDSTAYGVMSPEIAKVYITAFLNNNEYALIDLHECDFTYLRLQGALIGFIDVTDQSIVHLKHRLSHNYCALTLL